MVAHKIAEGRALLLRDHVYQSIRRAILSCEFKPGQELREQTLAERYHVSRSPIRDSLLRLELENLITVLPRQGYRVNEISVSDVEDIFGLRLLIEPACAAAAARRDDPTVRALDRLRGYAEGGTVQATFFEYNRVFHRAVADLSGNARMAGVAYDLTEQFDRVIRITMVDFQMIKVERLVQEHDAIIDAIQAHDPETASRLSYEHAADGRARIITALQQGVRPPSRLPEPASVGGGE
jgi:DNA-binding GntR family transcriptional regulator